ncbi:bifunctional enoyl-CoA hydratase/phosphate acetyltransferase [Natronoflexus pectinivorans]|uniref:Phosphate butyryltransferase n=1 Tax=Natronoflexus pectinivorans TaxID=682526 RepID=A0A4R2GLV7_9BACT|nr:bifunctional enoyl-CoA hydratase/phosphate acetyltransferase [Natronoflexus pectinivorans]TCO09298.1 phosphate butyryltransferase [Natronoflexus pectinivorans]
MFKHLNELQSLIDKSKPRKRLALAVSQDAYSLDAVYKAYKAGIIDPVLVGSEKLTNELANQHGYDLNGISIIDEPDPEKAVEIAVRMVHDGRADILMKGKVPTPVLLKGVLNKKWGLRTGQLLSHFSFFEVNTYHKLIGVTDVAMNIAPTLQEKIAIINNSVSYLNKLGIKRPKIAVLGAIEMVNENMQATLDAALLSKMNQRDQIKNCLIDGPLAFDNAVSKISAKNKGINSEVAGDTDILLMPDIEVGNVLYKSLVWFAKAKVASLVLGASAPIILTSRSDSEESKFDSILLAALG